MKASGSVSLKNLIELEILNPNSILIWKRRSAVVPSSATVNRDGSIRTEDGITHKSPSGAARHLNGGKPIDGWNVWRLSVTNESLADLRTKARTLKSWS